MTAPLCPASGFEPCLNPATLSGLGFTDFLHLASVTGFRAVEVSIQQVLAHGPERTAGLLTDLGLTVAAASGILPNGPILPHPLLIDDATFTAAMDGLTDRLAAAATIGCPVATTVLNPRTGAEPVAARTTATTRINQLARACAEHDMVLAVEAIGATEGLPPDLDGPHPVLSTLPELGDLLKEATRGHIAAVGVCVDSFHWAATGADPAALDGLPVAHVQIADIPAGIPPGRWTDGMRLFPGDGALDWSVLAAILRGVGYTAAVSVELFNPGLRALPDREIAQRALDGSRTCWSPAVAR